VSKLPRSTRGNYYREFIHLDIYGPISPITNRKKQYIISYINNYLKYIEIYLTNIRDSIKDTTNLFITRLNN
jgi:methylaspartate ammonia-lyase